jgi:hypothetical protein
MAPRASVRPRPIYISLLFCPYIFRLLAGFSKAIEFIRGRRLSLACAETWKRAALEKGKFGRKLNDYLMRDYIFHNEIQIMISKKEIENFVVVHIENASLVSN